jgi:GntR family transcriptional regulator
MQIAHVITNQKTLDKSQKARYTSGSDHITSLIMYLMNTMSIRLSRVDPLSAVPKYYQLAEILRQKIESDEWKTHDSLPAERELEVIYGVSRTTVREALNYLAKRGYIYREHGRGTFVARPKMQQSLHLLRSFTDDMTARGSSPGQRILELEYVEPTSRIRQQLELPLETSKVMKLERLRYADNEPIGIHTAYLPLSTDQPVTVDELLHSGSLYALLESKFNLIPVEAEQTIEATGANKEEAALLEVEEGSPLLLVERTSLSYQRQPMEFVKMLYRADRYKYHMHINR